MKKNYFMISLVRNIALVAWMVSALWLGGKAFQQYNLYNSNLQLTQVAGAGFKMSEIFHFTGFDKTILIVFVIALIVFIIFNKMQKKAKGL